MKQEIKEYLIYIYGFASALILVLILRYFGIN